MVWCGVVWCGVVWMLSNTDNVTYLELVSHLSDPWKYSLLPRLHFHQHLLLRSSLAQVRRCGQLGHLIGQGDVMGRVEGRGNVTAGSVPCDVM